MRKQAICVLQHVAVFFSVLQLCDKAEEEATYAQGGDLCVAVCCSVFQCVAIA